MLTTFAWLARKFNYCQPEILPENENLQLTIIKGRHPIIEKQDEQNIFIPNDSTLNQKDSFIQIITGPNMGGKSTYMRQTALIIIMAQIGSFIPAQSAKIPIFKRIFTRVGASDNITQGQSTFMVEMTEAAAILHQCDKNSFVILDEIGRGTSTYDGMCLAWSIIEYLHSKKIMTLFATHYHELTNLQKKLTGVFNTFVSLQEENNKIVFLHKICEGSINKSYGIKVAELAGVPKKVIKKAQILLEQFERERNMNITSTVNEKPLKTKNMKQLSLFEYKNYSLEKKIVNFSVDNSTPLDALNFLVELKNEIKDK